MADGVRFPISLFPSISEPVLQRGVLSFQVAVSPYNIDYFIPIVFLSRLDLILRLAAVGVVPHWWFQMMWEVYNKWHPSDPTKYTTWPLNRGCCVLDNEPGSTGVVHALKCLRLSWKIHFSLPVLIQCKSFLFCQTSNTILQVINSLLMFFFFNWWGNFPLLEPFPLRVNAFRLHLRWQVLKLLTRIIIK